MLGNVYEKTEKGREEIATRKFKLSARPRALLLLIDGSRSLAALSGSIGPAGQALDNAALLLEGGFIALRAMPPTLPKLVAPTVPIPVVAQPPAAPAKVPVSMHDIYSRPKP